jgi:hypothetical protein
MYRPDPPEWVLAQSAFVLPSRTLEQAEILHNQIFHRIGERCYSLIIRDLVR